MARQEARSEPTQDGIERCMGYAIGLVVGDMNKSAGFGEDFGRKRMHRDHDLKKFKDRFVRIVDLGYTEGYTKRLPSKYMEVSASDLLDTVAKDCSDALRFEDPTPKAKK